MQPSKDKTELLLKLIEIYGRKRDHYKISTFLINNIIEMGFERNNVEMAMSKMKQNPIFACLWLCGEEIDDSDEFEQNSPIFQALQQSSVLQEHLDNPHFFMSNILFKSI